MVKVDLDRIKFEPKHYYNGADLISEQGEQIQPLEVEPLPLPTGITENNIGTKLEASLNKLGIEDPFVKELARFELSNKYGLGFTPDDSVNSIGALSTNDRAFFHATRDARYVAVHVGGDQELKQKIEGRVTSNKELSEQRTQSQEETMKNRQYIQVNYTDKDRAKALGARFDGNAKNWFIPNSASDENRKQLLENYPEGKLEKLPPSMSPEDAFATFLRDNGVKLEGAPVMDGTLQRVALESDKEGKKSASYRAHLDGRVNGQLTNFKESSEPKRWIYTGQEISAEDREVMAKQAKENRAESQKLRSENQVNAGKIAFGIYANSDNAPESHPYAATKELDKKALSDLKVTDRGDLFVPVRDIEGKIMAGQFIKEDGAKYFLRNSKVKGGMHIVGDFNEIRNGDAKQVLIAEGVATAASLHEATGMPVVAAFNGGNLRPVAEAIRSKNPNASIIIAGDNDHAKEQNIGRIKAHEAANAVGGKVILPLLKKNEMERGLKDFNDLKVARGDISNTVKAAIASVTKGQTKTRQRQVEGMTM